MRKILTGFAFAALLVSIGCGTVIQPEVAVVEEIPPLRVGAAPQFPPLIFRQGGKLAGIEADLMRKLGNELQRPVKVVVLPWESLVDALVAGQVDVIMSGLMVTDARKVKIGFTESWMQSGLTVMVRQEDVPLIQSARDLQRFRGKIGVLAGTTGHDYVIKNCPQAKVIFIAKPGDAAVQLQRNIIDMYVDDIPTILWQASSHEAAMGCPLVRLSHAQVAWGVRREDAELVAQLNAALEKWRDDGSLDTTILKWIPYYESLK